MCNRAYSITTNRIEMGTRADFYVRKEKAVEWLCSIAWDGYPDGIDKPVLEATTEEQYRESLEQFVKDREDLTRPEMGWPWPWQSSRNTDYSYYFDNGKVKCSNWGRPFFDPLVDKNEPVTLERDEDVEWLPDMSAIQKIDFGARSGLLIIGRTIRQIEGE